MNSFDWKEHARNNPRPPSLRPPRKGMPASRFVSPCVLAFVRSTTTPYQPRVAWHIAALLFNTGMQSVAQPLRLP